MKQFIVTAQMISLALFGLITLLVLGAEPSEMSEAGLERYQADTDYLAPILLWSWLGSIVTFLGFTALRLVKKIGK